MVKLKKKQVLDLIGRKYKSIKDKVESLKPDFNSDLIKVLHAKLELLKELRDEIRKL